ncbi:MAG: PAS domain-containing protein [Candidatus Omnitrophota bacterium]
MGYLIVSNILFLLLVLTIGQRCLKCCIGERKTRNILNHIVFGYFRCRLKDGIVLASNKEFSEILELGAAPGDILGRPIERLVVAVNPDEFILKEIKEKKQLRGFECRVKTLTGKEKVLALRGCVVPEPDTREEIAEIFLEDVTERTEFYDKMRKSREKYEKVFNSSGDMVVIFDPYEMIIKEANFTASETTGFSQEELSGTRMDLIVHPMDRQKFTDLAKDLALSGKSNIETVLVCKDGRYRNVLFTITISEMADKKMVIAVAKDISHYAVRKEEEEKRRKELEVFLRSCVEREDRINTLRHALEEAGMRIKMLEEKNGKSDERGKG